MAEIGLDRSGIEFILNDRGLACLRLRSRLLSTPEMPEPCHIGKPIAGLVRWGEVRHEIAIGVGL